MLEVKEFSLKKACQSADYIINLQEVIQTHSNESARNFGMSILNSLIEENEKSLENLEFLIKKNPDIPLLHERIAEFCINSERYDKAVIHLEKIVELEDLNLTARFWLCLLYYVLGKNDRAKAGLKLLRKLVYQMRVKTRDWRDQ